jgi:hypothetical protein
MLFDDETSLAWALTEAARPHLSPAERDEVHVTIAVGETFSAIHHLITSAADRRIPLTPELVQRCRIWLDAYAGHEHERHLRCHLEGLPAPHRQSSCITVSASSRCALVPRKIHRDVTHRSQSTKHVQQPSC